MAKVTISLAEFDELRGIKEKFDESVKNIREEIRGEFVGKVTEMAKEIGRKDGIINELQNKMTSSTRQSVIFETIFVM